MTSPSTDRRYGVNSGIAIKAPCRVATTANITLNGTQTIDGVAVGADDRALVKNQIIESENGIYVVDTGDWTRDFDCDGNRDLVQGTLVYVNSGSTNAGTVWQLTTANPITIDTTSLTWTVGLFTGLGSTSFLQAGTGAVAWAAQNKMRERVSVTDFGASTSASGAVNSAAIQAAIDSVSTGGNVYFPVGTFTIATSLTLYSAVTLVGAGMDSTILSYTGSSDAVKLTSLTKCGVRDMGIVGTAAATSCITMIGTTLSTIFNVAVRGSVVGIAVGTGNENLFMQVAANSCTQDGFWFTTNANNCTMIGCEAVSNVRAGLFSQGARQLACYSCAFETNAYGVYITTTGSGTSRTSGLLLSNCYIEGNSTYEVYSITGGSSLYPRGISIKDCYFVCITAKATSAIRIEDIDGLEIDGCMFDDISATYTYPCYVNNAGSISGVVWGLNTNKATNDISVQSGKTYHDIRKSTARAWGRFTVSGAAIASSNMYQCSVAYVSAGVYEVTLATAMSGTNYAPIASAENGASNFGMFASVGQPISTTVFRIGTCITSTANTEARTVTFSVFA